MARTVLPVQQVARTGLIPAYSAANADGHSIANDGRVFHHVKNGSGSSINVTMPTPVTVDDLAVADLVVAIAAGAEKMIGPFPPGIYNQADGTMHVDYSAVTTVTVAAVRL
jgi:hypothetical protein